MTTQTYENCIIEQYKLYVEMMDRVTERRGQANKFYLSIISALSGFMALIADPKKEMIHSEVSFLLMSLFGIFLCFSWWININSHKNLNSLKFRVIHEIEEELPFPCYKREWELDKNPYFKYRRLSRVEKIIPCLLGFTYFLLSFYSISILIK